MLLRTSVCAVALTGLVSAPDDLAFTVDANSIVSKTFEEATEWELGAASMTMDGDDMGQEVPPVEGTYNQTVRVNDEYEAVEGGRITQLLREYVEVTAASTLTLDDGGEVNEYETSSTSPIESALVRFTWNESESDYDVEVEEGANNNDIRGLVIDMDLLGLLPTEAVEAGDSWKLSGSDLACVFRAGGDFKLGIDEATEGSMFNVPTAAILSTGLASAYELLGDAEGEVTAKLEGTEDVDGRRLATIKLKGSVKGERDLSELLQNAANANLENTDNVTQWTLESAMEFEFEGILLWDLGAGRFHSLELGGDFNGEHTLAWTESIFDQVSEMGATYENQGTTKIRVELGEE